MIPDDLRERVTAINEQDAVDLGRISSEIFSPEGSAQSIGTECSTLPSVRTLE